MSDDKKTEQKRCPGCPPGREAVKNDHGASTTDPNVMYCPCSDYMEGELSFEFETCKKFWHLCCAGLHGLSKDMVNCLESWNCPDCYICPHSYTHTRRKYCQILSPHSLAVEPSGRKNNVKRWVARNSASYKSHNWKCSSKTASKSSLYQGRCPRCS